MELQLNSKPDFHLNWKDVYVSNDNFIKFLSFVFLYQSHLQIERHIFESTINRLNEYFAEAEKGSCSTYCEGCLACVTAYLVYMCSETHYEKVNENQVAVTILIKLKSFQCLRKISKYIASQNERIYNPKGLQLTDPTYRGLRVIEISILDRPMRT